MSVPYGGGVLVVKVRIGKNVRPRLAVDGRAGADGRDIDGVHIPRLPYTDAAVEVQAGHIHQRASPPWACHRKYVGVDVHAVNALAA